MEVGQLALELFRSQIDSQSQIHNGVLVAVGQLENQVKETQLDLSGVKNRITHLEIIGGVTIQASSSSMGQIPPAVVLGGGHPKENISEKLASF